MNPHEELEVLAIQARQATQVVDALRDKLDALTDPHTTFARHAIHLSTCIHLLNEAADEVAAVARIYGKRLREIGGPR